MSKKLFLLAAVVLLITGACSGSFIDPGALEVTGGGFGGGFGGGGTGGGDKNATYDASWNDFQKSLEIVFGSINPEQTKSILSAVKLTDIVLTPNDVISLGTLDTTGVSINIKNCNVLKSGTVKVTLKNIAGYKFTVASWGTDTITVKVDETD